MNQVEMRQCRRKGVNGHKIAGAIRSLVNAIDLQLECARLLHEKFLVPILIYDNDSMLWKEKERSK